MLTVKYLPLVNPTHLTNVCLKALHFHSFQSFYFSLFLRLLIINFSIDLNIKTLFVIFDFFLNLQILNIFRHLLAIHQLISCIQSFQPLNVELFNPFRQINILSVLLFIKQFATSFLILFIPIFFHGAIHIFHVGCLVFLILIRFLRLWSRKHEAEILSFWCHVLSWFVLFRRLGRQLVLNKPSKYLKFWDYYIVNNENLF